MKRTNPMGDCLITTMEIQTPNDIENYLKSFDIVKDAVVSDFIGEPALVVRLKLKPWPTVRCLFSENYRLRIDSLKYAIFRNVPQELKTLFIVEI